MDEVDKTGILGLIGLILSAVLFFMVKTNVLTVIFFVILCWIIGYLTGSKQEILKKRRVG